MTYEKKYFFLVRVALGEPQLNVDNSSTSHFLNSTETKAGTRTYSSSGIAFLGKYMFPKQLLFPKHPTAVQEHQDPTPLILNN